MTGTTTHNLLRLPFPPVRAALLLVLPAACSLAQEPAGGAEATRERPPALAWEHPLQVASGNAYRGPWRMNESVFDFVDDPTVAVDRHGRIAVAWADHTRKDILFQLFSPDGEPLLEEPANVSHSPRIFSWLPRVVLAASEGAERLPGGDTFPLPRAVFVLWQEIVFSGGSHGGEIFFARSTDGGRTFSEPANLSNTKAGAGKGRLSPRSWHNGSLDLAMGPQGDLYATWTEYEGNLWFCHSTDNGQTFSAPLHIAGAEGEKPARGPSLAVTQGGAVHLAWTVGEDPSADIHWTVSRDRGGSFAPPQAAHVRPGHADAPKLAAGPGGTLHLVWAESAEGPAGAYRILHARAAPEDGTGGADTSDADPPSSPFREPKPVVDGAAAGVASVHFPSLATDTEGRLHLLFERFPSHRGRPQGLGLARSLDGGDTFLPPVLVPGTAHPDLGSSGSQQGLLMRKLAAGPSGTLAIVNSTFRSGASSHIWLHRARN